MFSGTYTALITPFKNDKIDEKAFEKLIEFQIQGGVEGIVPCGTTGESPTLDHHEHNHVIELALNIAQGRIKVIAGTGSNSTQEAIMMTKHAAKIGVDGCLIVAPYYNKPTPEGLYQHFKAINDACEVPLILYNIPGRSVINISDEVIARLAQLKNIVGLKDATGDLARLATLKLMVDDNFCLLSGEDATAVGFNAMGGVGVISVTANIAPKLVADLQKACRLMDYKKALTIQDQLTNLHMAMFCETNPVPVKYAASLLGLCDEAVRLPLWSLSAASKDKVKKALVNLGLI
jgi:4-hydroxy-tetrahydrodipicolinate synthase